MKSGGRVSKLLYLRKVLILSFSVILFGVILLLVKGDFSVTKLAPVLEIPSQATSIAWDRESTRLAVGHVDREISVWKILNKRLDS